MVPRYRHRVALGCLVVVALFGAVAPGDAVPPPRPLCDACGEAFEATAEAHGVDLTVERSVATVSVRENGSATWVVRNHLENSSNVERLRSNATLRMQVADRAMWDTDALDATVSPAGVLTMRYREVDFAEPSVGGTLRSGEFTSEYGYRNLDGLGADRLVVVAPNGSHVGRTVPGATVSDGDRRMTLTSLETGGFVTFVPRDAAFGPLWSALAVGSVVVPAVALNAFVAIVLPTAVVALLIGVGGGVLSRLERDRVGELGPARVRSVLGREAKGKRPKLKPNVAVVGALALLAGVGLVLFGGYAAPLFGIGVAVAALGVALGRPSVRERATYRTLVVGAAFGTVLAVGVTVAIAVGITQKRLHYALLSSLPSLVPIFALLPAGYAAGRGNRPLAAGTIAVGFALAVAPFASFTSPAVGGSFVPSSVSALGAASYAIGIAVVGTPLLVAGASLATADDR
ncbi:MAG: hypothetical protein ACOCZD_02640 [Haloferacaceae archaeon]